MVEVEIHGDQKLLVGIWISLRSMMDGELQLISQSASAAGIDAAGNAAQVSRGASSMGWLFDFGSVLYYGLPGAPFIIAPG